jgi:hypothetical protein
MGLTYTCGFCDKNKNRDKDSPTYIYPVPIAGEAGQTPDNREGRYACSKCTIEQKRLQREMGLVEVHHYSERN